ncbi:MAG: BlaI/MecI/CopY family transcriptional regulator [Xanthomonadales bacterium]|nr:BlaI/MecI/CopY family transcriptional regulator [Xanthomonadales bacterium]
MTRRPTPKPTEAELAILHILWARGASTVRQIHDLLYRDQASYTTSLKLLQIMFGKGLVVRDDSQRAHIFQAAVSQDETQADFVSDVLRRVFKGSSSQLVLHALGSAPPATAEELADIRTLLDRIEKGETGSDTANDKTKKK